MLDWLMVLSLLHAGDHLPILPHEGQHVVRRYCVEVEVKPGLVGPVAQPAVH
jgi:hypothetical protein